MERLLVSPPYLIKLIWNSVRKIYGKELAQKRLERNYNFFYKIRYDLMVAAQCKIAFVWRMNRIKIKLARKKREKDEAAKKKAM